MSACSLVALITGQITIRSTSRRELSFFSKNRWLTVKAEHIFFVKGPYYVDGETMIYIDTAYIHAPWKQHTLTKESTSKRTFSIQA